MVHPRRLQRWLTRPVSLVALRAFKAALCVCLSSSGQKGESSQILYTKRAALSSQTLTASSPAASVSTSSLPQGSPDSRPPPSRPVTSSPQSQAAARAREFAADLFRRAQGGAAKEKEGQVDTRTGHGAEDEAPQKPGDTVRTSETVRDEKDCGTVTEEEQRSPQASTSGHSLPQCPELRTSSASSSSSPSPPTTPSSSQEVDPSEPGYVNYSRLHYRLQQPGAVEPNAAGAGGERLEKYTS